MSLIASRSPSALSPMRKASQSVPGQRPISYLEDKRRGVMSRTEAGYFIRDWQDISNQVRQMVSNDARYQQLQAANGQREV